VLLIVSLFSIAARPLQAPSPDVSVIVQLAYAAFIALVGWPALLSVIVTALQYYNVLTPSTSETFMFWANVVVFGGIFILALLGKISLVNSIDAAFGMLAKVLLDVLILLGVPLGFRFARDHAESFRNTYMFQNAVMRRSR
jgi:hypothetical protein